MATPQKIWKGTTELIEQSDSPHFDLSEQLTGYRKFKAPYEVCVHNAAFRGSYINVLSALCRVTSSTVQREKGGIGVLIVNFEIGNAREAAAAIGIGQSSGGEPDLPRDECEIIRDRIDVSLEKHVRYAGESVLFDEAEPKKPVPDKIVLMIKNYIDARNDDERKNNSGFLTPGHKDYNRFAVELYNRLIRGFTHFALFPPVYRWVTHSWDEPENVSAGGFIETPFGPLKPPRGTEWLRCADNLNHNGSFFRLQRMWLGGNGYWDRVVYGELTQS